MDQQLVDEHEETPAAAWPPTFPHLEIDDLLSRLRDAESAAPEEVAVLLALVSREAQRLRATVARLSAERLTRADEQAGTIVREALEQAARLRRLGIDALVDRLDEADRIAAGTRSLVGVEEATARTRTGPGRAAGPRGDDGARETP